MDTRTKSIMELKVNAETLETELLRAKHDFGLSKIAENPESEAVSEYSITRDSITEREARAKTVSGLLESLAVTVHSVRLAEKTLNSHKKAKEDLFMATGRAAIAQLVRIPAFSPYRERGERILSEIRDLELAIEAAKIDAATKGFFGGMVQSGKIALKKASIGGKRQEYERALFQGGKAVLEGAAPDFLPPSELDHVFHSWRDLCEKEARDTEIQAERELKLAEIKTAIEAIAGKKPPRVFIMENEREITALRQRCDSLVISVAERALATAEADEGDNGNALRQIRILEAALERDRVQLSRLESSKSIDELAVRRAKTESRLNAARKREGAIGNTIGKLESELAGIDGRIAELRKGIDGAIDGAAPDDDDFVPPDLD